MNFNFGIGIGEHWINTDLYANEFHATQTNGEIATNTINHDSKPLLYGYFSVGYHFSKKSEITTQLVLQINLAHQFPLALAII